MLLVSVWPLASYLSLLNLFLEFVLASQREIERRKGAEKGENGGKEPHDGLKLRTTAW